MPPTPTDDSAHALPQQRLEILYEISRALPVVLDRAELVQRIVDKAVESVAAERGILFLKGADGTPRPEVVRGADDTTVASALETSRRILDHALTGEATLSDDARSDTRFDSPSVVAYNIVSFMCVPIRRADEILGTLYVDHRSVAELFTREDLAFLSALADLSAVALDNARMHDALNREAPRRPHGVERTHRFGNLLGASGGMLQLIHVLERVADTDATVLIQGENGTGKELVARALHAHSHRRDHPFVTVDCGSLIEGLAASQLFGHRRGAFTGASEDRLGMLERAEGGTVFLDQIEDLPLSLQPHLLRALQEGEVRRVGDTEYRKVSWRAVAASRLDLAERVRAGAFREDLYYRLRVVPILVPPLRRRGADIPLLAQHFLDQTRARLARGPEGFTPAALEAIEAYAWPGNVRELEHAVERAVLLATGPRIDVADLALEPHFETPGTRPPGGRSPAVAEVTAALRRHVGNVSHAAATLGITRRALQKIMRRHGLERDAFRDADSE